MWRLFILILSPIVSASFIPSQYDAQSAASESQIRLAIENKYDNTGPGAKEPETAYRTYKTLQDALISYLDDPDTKLPEYERTKAVAALQGNHYDSLPIRPPPKSVEEYTGYIERPNVNQYHPQRFVYNGNDNYGYQVPKVNNVINYNNVQANPGVPSYVNDPDIQVAHDQFDVHPKYSFSYGVHDKHTGDSKSAHEFRNGGVVRGYYTFLDADGKQRTVHYTADDRLGFRANVQRTHANTQ